MKRKNFLGAKVALALISTVALAVPSSWAAPGDPLGPPILVGAASVQALFGTMPLVAVNSSGETLTLFQDLGGLSVRGYDSNGNPLGDAVVIVPPSRTVEYVVNPAITALTNGKFAVAWLESDKTRRNKSLKAQIFDATGVASGKPSIIARADEADWSTSITGECSEHCLAATPDGGFAAVWNDYYQGNWVLEAQRFDSIAQPTGAPIVVDSTSGSNPTSWLYASIAVDVNDNALVVYENAQRTGGVPPAPVIYARAWSARTGKLSARQTLNDQTLTEVTAPTVVSKPDGGFLAVWATTATGATVFGRTFSTHGIAGPQLTLASDESLSIYSLSDYVSLGIAGSGNYVIASTLSDGNGLDGMIFDASNTAITSLLSIFPGFGITSGSHLAVAPNGNVSVVLLSNALGSLPGGVYLQLLSGS